MWEDEAGSKKDLAAYWGADPVHLTPLGYTKLAEKLSERMDALRTKKRERERERQKKLHGTEALEVESTP